MHKHVCSYMTDDNFSYIYKWTGDEAGWRLFSNDEPIMSSSSAWVHKCGWCTQPLPVIDTMPPNDLRRKHRCEAMIRNEWYHNQVGLVVLNQHQNEDEQPLAPIQLDIVRSNFLLNWDGFMWNSMNNDEILARRLQRCPYCNSTLEDPRKFNNKVEIT